MDEVYALSDTFGQFLNSIYGFDYKWDQSSERKHIKRSEFHTEFHKALKKYGHMNWMEKLELEFPDLADLLNSHEVAVNLKYLQIETKTAMWLSFEYFYL